MNFLLEKNRKPKQPKCDLELPIFLLNYQGIGFIYEPPQAVTFGAQRLRLLWRKLLFVIKN